MHKFKHQIAKAMYRTTWPIWHFLFKFFLHCNIYYEDKQALKALDGPVILMSNHVAWFDPFMVGTSFHQNPKLFPIRWLTKGSLFRRPIVGQTVWLYGSIKLEKGLGLERTLQEAVDILKNNGIVGIFPQGRVWKGGRPRNGRTGAAYLAMQTNPTIVPAHISGLYKMSFLDFILRRKRVDICIGKPFKLPEEFKNDPANLHPAATHLWGKVRELKK